MRQDSGKVATLTVGIDLGDRMSQVVVLDDTGECVEEARIATKPEALRGRFASASPCRIAIEAGTHSAWIARLLESCGHEVIVANPRKLRLIYENDAKDDRADAEYLARLARLDKKLLSPIQHRSPEVQADRALLRARDALVESRTRLVNCVRGLVKACGGRLPACSTNAFPKAVAGHVPEIIKPAVVPLLDQIADLGCRIAEFDRQLEDIAKTRYPETAQLRQVPGVGLLTSLAFVLTIEDPSRFQKSRDVGAYVGLVPRRRQSGASDPQLRISKAGDSGLRRLLVSASHYVLGKYGPDSDLKRWGSKLAARGGKSAKKRAVVAVARKLAVLLHRLWVTGEIYEPLRNSTKKTVAGE